MTRDEAFKHLTSQRCWYKKANITPTQASSLKLHYNRGTIEAGTVERLLQAAGYVDLSKWEAP